MTKETPRITVEMVDQYLNAKQQEPSPFDDTPLEVPPGFSAAKIFDDPTPNAVINHRIMLTFMQMARYADLNSEERNQFADILILIARKMIAVWNHLDRYHAEERRLVDGFASGAMNHIDCSQTLFNEFDEFTVQIKSTLDHLVKIMIPMVGAKRWNIRTFGNKGEDVVSMLKRNLPKEYEGRAHMMEVRLFQEHKAWLDAVIGARDRVNHYLDGGINIKTFSVLRRPDGKIEVPLWSGEQTLADMMDASWALLLRFVEDFIAMALYFRIPMQTYSIMWRGVAPTSQKSPWHLVRKELADNLLQNPGWKPV